VIQHKAVIVIEPQCTEPAAACLAKTHPEVATRAFQALGTRILKAKKSKYYAAALSHLKMPDTATGGPAWITSGDAEVAEVRQAHHRRWVLCRVSNGSSQAKDRARDRPFSSVRGTAGWWPRGA
jgi:hypothetical protein